MSVTQKQLSQLDGNQTLKGAYNDVDASLTTSGFLSGKVGRKITQTITTTNVANDTIVFQFMEDSILLYEITQIYTDATYSTMISAERTQ